MMLYVSLGTRIDDDRIRERAAEEKRGDAEMLYQIARRIAFTAQAMCFDEDEAITVLIDASHELVDYIMTAWGLP